MPYFKHKNIMVEANQIQLTDEEKTLKVLGDWLVYGNSGKEHRITNEIFLDLFELVGE